MGTINQVFQRQTHIARVVSNTQLLIFHLEVNPMVKMIFLCQESSIIHKISKLPSVSVRKPLLEFFSISTSLLPLLHLLLSSLPLLLESLSIEGELEEQLHLPQTYPTQHSLTTQTIFKILCLSFQLNSLELILQSARYVSNRQKQHRL